MTDGLCQRFMGVLIDTNGLERSSEIILDKEVSVSSGSQRFENIRWRYRCVHGRLI
jgi:hypothetical protein